MREFLVPRPSLSQLSPGLRLSYTVFLLFTLASYGVMLALALERSGCTPDSVARYYAGGGESYAKTRGELLELTHFHLFSMPVLLFVQGHVFLMTRWPRRLKLALFAAAWIGAALDLAAPWLVLDLSRGLAWTKLAGRALLAPALLAFALAPLIEMWSARRAAR